MKGNAVHAPKYDVMLIHGHRQPDKTLIFVTYTVFERIFRNRCHKKRRHFGPFVIFRIRELNLHFVSKSETHQINVVIQKCYLFGKADCQFVTIVQNVAHKP